MKHTIYRIFVIGSLPPDLRDKIANIHVAGILASKKEGENDKTREENAHNKYSSVEHNGNR